MQYTVETITPAIAVEWLSKNTNNRNVTRANVKFIADQIKSGGWRLNGESIKFSKSGVLLDGQHRLLAVIEANIPITTIVVRGVDDDTFSTIDTGRPRKAGDVMSIDGYKNANNLAAALRVIDTYYMGHPFGTRYSNAEILGLAKKYISQIEGQPCAHSSVRFMHNKIQRMLIAPLSVCSAAHYIFSAISMHEANLFMERIFDGTGLGADSPELLLKNRLIANRIAKSSLPPKYIFMLIVKAWNHRRAGNSIKCLRVRTDGDSPEEMPIAI